MTTELIRATIRSIDKTASKAGDPAIRITCNHPDESEWGQRVTDWIGLDKAPSFVFKRWAQLVEPGCNTDKARDILTGNDWRLIGLTVEIEVDKDGTYGWDVKSVQFPADLEADPKPTTNGITHDDIPF
jgi:hypothetical protein